GSARWRRC
ncbi:hypothetical protein CP10743SC13_2106B, partial [Chlamydia psittaci 10_743_SC13]